MIGEPADRTEFMICGIPVRVNVGHIGPPMLMSVSPMRNDFIYERFVHGESNDAPMVDVTRTEREFEFRVIWPGTISRIRRP